MLLIHTARISNLLCKRLRGQTEGVTRINDPNAYVLPATRRVSGDCRPLVSAVRLWSALPQEFKSLACHRSFKRLLKVYFHGQQASRFALGVVTQLCFFWLC